MDGQVTIIARRRGSTNDELARAWCALGIETRVLAPEEALGAVSRGEVALIRLDVLDTLDGIEAGLEDLDVLAQAGARILNTPEALRAAHDKLETAFRLRAARLPHPRTAHVLAPDAAVELSPPVVVKPRFGSWGRDVFRCSSERELRDCLEALRDRSWFRRHGALVQELVALRGFDLRLIVAGGRVVGAGERVAPPGEWRTNVSLGAELRATRPDSVARVLGVAAAAVLGADLVGVDLVPTDAGWVVLEVNGAVDFDDRYWLEGTNVYAEVANALGLTAHDTEVESTVARGAGALVRAGAEAGLPKRPSARTDRPSSS
jgi:[lysine-biosynthesis-protein LysW]--L-2-aminoadipate ligase